MQNPYIPLTETHMTEIRTIRLMKANIDAHLPEDFTEDQMVSILESVIIKAFNQARLSGIHADFETDDFQKLCLGVYRHVMINIEKCPKYMSSLLTEAIPCKIAALVDEFEKNPKKWVDIRKELELKENESISSLNITTDVQCFKCKQNEVFMIPIQTRSADEPETLFYQCMRCDNKWRKSGA
jgi:DNA-directed RNA polymerase III subunit RPC11